MGKSDGQGTPDRTNDMKESIKTKEKMREKRNDRKKSKMTKMISCTFLTLWGQSFDLWVVLA